jgi:hypothetical protein
MDHEVGPWKMAFVDGPSSWSNFHGLTSSKLVLKALGPSLGVTRMWTKKNEPPPKSEGVDVLIHSRKGQFLKKY